MALFGTASKVDNLLQERSKLVFEFPGQNYGDRVCPFFENPRISEKKSSNLIKYDVLGRSSNFFGYTGAKSRSLNVEFFIPLPHVVYMATNELFQGSFARQKTTQEQQMDFFNKKSERNENHILTTTYKEKRKEFLKKINAGLDPDNVADHAKQMSGVFNQDGASNLAGLAANEATYFTPEMDLTTDLQAYDKPHIFGQALEIILFWINLVRSTTLTARTNPTLGPPILRLYHGVLFDGIATIAENYAIDVDESAGYDIVSLLPNRIKINLSLFEIQRTYDANSEVQTAVKHTDMLQGWDDILAQEADELAFKKTVFDEDYYGN